MCGICGKLNRDGVTPVSAQLLKEMADSIAHRGPDDEGFYRSGPVGLGFRRLSIIDLVTGHQPLANEDNSVWIVFNGEIYNYLPLREELIAKGHIFKTHTDTEVMVHLYEDHGERFVERLRGMFALAIWDGRKKQLLIARDRVGIKPLYYYSDKDSVIFASEIKALLADPSVRPEIVPNMIDRFLTFNYVPGSETLLKDVRKLPPGHYMVVNSRSLRVERYWDLKFEQRTITERDAEEELEQILDESVRMHMISDVPVGFLLSGGVDSTAMLSFAVGKTDKQLSSYTVGFSDPSVTDERPFARLAASKYGVEYHETTISAKDFADFLPEYVWHMEEPVCEPPAIALYYVSRLAREHVKVLISGEGGDEAFAGYPNYRTMLWLERVKSALGPFKGIAAASLGALNGIFKSSSVAQYAPLFNVPFDSYYYSRTSSPFKFFNQHARDIYTSEFARSVHKSASLTILHELMQRAPGDKDLVNRMLYIDTMTWLPDDLLVKADKMTMASSVELRVPMLDHVFLEFAASLPGHLKVRGLGTKYLAKRVLSKRIPQEIVRRKKQGFPVPYSMWMRTVLRDWLHDVLLDSKTIARGYFQKSAVERLLAAHDSQGLFSKEIFSLVVLELWHRRFLDRSRSENAYPVLGGEQVIVSY